MSFANLVAARHVNGLAVRRRGTSADFAQPRQNPPSRLNHKLLLQTITEQGPDKEIAVGNGTIRNLRHWSVPT